MTSSKWALALVLFSFISIFTTFILFSLPYFYAISSQFTAVMRGFPLADYLLMGKDTILLNLMEL